MIKFKFFCDNFLKLATHFKNYTPLTILTSHEKNKPSFIFLLPLQEIEISDPNHPWENLKRQLYFDNTTSSDSPQWSGFLSYELGAFSDPDKTLEFKNTPLPYAYFFKAACVIEHFDQNITITLFDESYELLSIVDQNIFTAMCQSAYWEKLLQNLKDLFIKELKAERVILQDDQQNYCLKIDRAKEHILSGDVYQINLSTQMLIHTEEDAFEIFLKLSQINPTPFAAFINQKDYQIISASPERFLKFNQGKLLTSPIKGTIARGLNAQEDQANKLELLSNLKEDAELMMICDLMRNDLGKVSEIGSVKCIQKKEILEFSNVFHLQSTVISTAKKTDSVDLLRAAFPAGSITGCPKIRAMEIIYEIEQRARHIYCGAIGYFCTNGDFDFNVAIRTALLQNQTLHIQMGGAITYDSILINEYEEILHKANPFLKIFNLDFFNQQKISQKI